MLQVVFRILLSDQLPVLSVSEDVTSLLGYTAQDFLSSTVHLVERIHPDDSDIASQLFSPIVDTGCGPFSIRIRHSDNRIRCMRAEAKKDSGPDGHAVLTLTLQDARNLWKPPNPLDVLTNLKALMENTDDFIFFKDRNHIFTAANQLFMPGSSNVEPQTNLVGCADYDLLPEEYADVSYAQEKAVFAGASLTNKIQPAPPSDGAESWIECRRFPVRNEKGEIAGLLALTRDVSDHMRAEAALKESERSLRDAQRIAGFGSYVLDLVTGAVACSDEVCEQLGVAKDYHDGLSGWANLIHPDDRATVIAHFTDEVLGKGIDFDKEYRIVRPNDGAVRWVHAQGLVERDSHRRAVRFRGTVRDITEHKNAELALRESQMLLQLFIEHAPAALAMCDRNMRYIAVSKLWRESLGIGDRDIIGQSHYEAIPDLPKRWKWEHRRALLGESFQRSGDRLRKSDGTDRWVRREVRPWFKGDGSIGGVVIFSEDITDRKQLELRLQLAASVFTHASEGIMITDANGGILDVNEAFTKITGYTRDEVLGRNPKMLHSGRQSKEFYSKMWRSLARAGHWHGELWNRGKDGRIFLEDLTISTVADPAGKTQQYVAQFSDVSSTKDREEKLERIAHFDVLTGLPNRMLFADRLRQAMAQARQRQKPMMLLSLDLDNFKSINDRVGRDGGDQAMAAVAKQMALAMRDGDTLARLGGDEFAAIFVDLDDHAHGVAVLGRLLSAVSEPVTVGNQVLNLWVSAGASYYPHAEEVDADLLLRQADQAMYRAKLQGRNRYLIFDPWLDRNMFGRNEELDEIRRGLESNEFELYYQPKVNMSTGGVLGAEALIRWQHPKRGLLAPSQFLPIVEGNPLGIELGEWTLDTALSQVELWREEGLQMPVSVNVSPQQLEQTGFVDRIAALLAAHPTISPSMLELEVLESSALTDIAQVSQVMRACSRLGVGFALDDFGTGYSSLSYLKRLPVEVLKIDQTFIRNMHRDPEDLSIVEGVLGLAAAFHHHVIAEGVETVEHGLLLLRLGCQFAQGYGIARPMPAHELPGWVSSWQPDPRWIGISELDRRYKPILYTGAEHSAFVVAIDAYLNGHREVAPILDHSLCRLGMWMNGDASDGRDWLTLFQTVETTHETLHALATEVLQLKLENRTDEAMSRLPQLYAFCSRLYEALQCFIDQEQFAHRAYSSASSDGSMSQLLSPAFIKPGTWLNNSFQKIGLSS